MKTKLLFLFVLFFVAARAQTYTVTQIPYNPFPYDSGIQVVTPNDDAWGIPVGIGFDFYFFGQPYQQLVVGTNGIVTFEMNQANGYCQWPISAAIPAANNPINSIMISWQDLYPTGMGNPVGLIRHYVFGTAPHRHFVVSYDSIPMYSCWTIYFSGQLILNEGSNDIEIHISDKNLCSQWNGGNAILGIQNNSGTQAFWASNYNYPNQWTDSSNAWLFHPDSIYSPLTTNLNSISGRVFADNNHDCAFNGTDFPLMNIPLIFSDTAANYLSYMYADMNGNYSKLVDTGTFNVSTFNLANSLYVSTCPPTGSYTINFPTLNDSSNNNNFADTVTLCSDLHLFITAADTNYIPSWWGNVMQPCDTNYLFLEVGNGGTHSDTTTVTVTLNDSTQIISSPVSYTSLGNNQYQFNVGYVAAGSSQTVTIVTYIGCDTVGTVYCYSGNITGTCPIDCGNYSNTNFHCIGIGVPYDPNEMYVAAEVSGNALLQPQISAHTNDALNYLITFQNTGSGVAHNVKVKTVLDSHIDYTSILPLSASNNFNWLILGDTLIFDFNGINLPDSGSNMEGSKGWITFSANQVSGNTPGTIIIHHAGIYFDFMSPVLTNNAVVHLQSSPSGFSTINENLFSVFPNPVSDVLHFTLPKNAEFVITNILGSVILQGKGSGLQQLNVSDWIDGIYFCKIISKNSQAVVRFVKQ